MHTHMHTHKRGAPAGLSQWENKGADRLSGVTAVSTAVRASPRGVTHTAIHTHTHPYTAIHTHTHAHTAIHTHTHPHTHPYTHTHTHTHTHTDTHTPPTRALNPHTHPYPHIHSHTHAHTAIHTHTHAHTPIHTAIHTHTHTHTHNERSQGLFPALYFLSKCFWFELMYLIQSPDAQSRRRGQL